MNKTEVKKGDKFILTENINTAALLTWGASTIGFDFTLPKNTIIIVDEDHVPGAKGFSAVPQNYKEIEEIAIPASHRKQQYSGYNLVFLIEDIGSKLRPLNQSK